MIRRTEQTVRRRVARIAPTTRVWALIQTRSENSGAKAARMATISGGRSTGVVSRADGLCSTIDRGHAPLDLPVNLAKVKCEMRHSLMRRQRVVVLHGDQGMRLGLVGDAAAALQRIAARGLGIRQRHGRSRV